MSAAPPPVFIPPSSLLQLYTSGEELTQECAEYVQSILSDHMAESPTFRKEKAHLWIQNLFGINAKSIPDNLVSKSGANGSVVFPKSTYMEIPIVLKLIALTKENNCVQSNPRIACDNYLHELVVNLMTSFFLQQQANPNLLDLFGDFEQKDKGVLVLERAFGSMDNLRDIVDWKVYNALTQRYGLEHDTIAVILLLQCLLSLDQLENSVHFLHADLSWSNIFLSLVAHNGEPSVQLDRIDLNNSETPIHRFFIPNIGIKPVLADFSISVFSLNTILYLQKEPPRLGLVETPTHKNEYWDFAIDPYLMTLPHNSKEVPAPSPDSQSKSKSGAQLVRCRFFTARVLQVFPGVCALKTHPEGTEFEHAPKRKVRGQAKSDQVSSTCMQRTRRKARRAILSAKRESRRRERPDFASPA